MPRAIWSGAISFGLVSIPVNVYTAVSRKSVRFNQLDGRTGSRIKQKRVSALDGEDVPFDEIVKGYEVSKDSYVIVDEDELDALMPKASRTIDITDFVEQVDIDPVLYESAYYLVPDELARKSYALLTQAMEESGRVAIATFVMRTKQYLAAVRPVDGRLMLSTMLYPDELSDPLELPGFEELAQIEVTEAEKAMANQLIESLSADFEPGKYEDTYRAAVMEMLEKKASGELTVAELPAAADDDSVIDLLAALEASVAAAKQARKRHPASNEENQDEGDSDEGSGAKPKNKTAKKAAKRKSKVKSPTSDDVAVAKSA
ncbi:MAG: DNA end-binding protein Ku [Acidimicrobiales bacterium]|jgi:DNA end-binding protein Ku